MSLQIPDATEPLAPEWFEPLRLVVDAQAGERLTHFLEIDDLGVTARLVRPPRPTIVLYKHRFTRAYLNLDAAGQAYRYVPVRTSSHGRYDRQPLARALRGLGLDELPWLKPELDGERRGLRWEERAILRIQLDREYTARGRPPPPYAGPARHGRRAGLRLPDEPALPAGARGGVRRGHLHLV